MDTSFTRLVGCRVPIQQAPMGTVSSPDLAVAVAEAGGVGTITALLNHQPAHSVSLGRGDPMARGTRRRRWRLRLRFEDEVQR